MQIKKLTLYTTNLEKEKAFYKNTLGFPITENTRTHFSLQVGHSQLSFEKSSIQHPYHYCFLIPKNQLTESIDWLRQRLDIIEIEPGQFTQRFESWNADSVYFYDASGNVAEFIVRHDLDNASNSPFERSSIISVNEIGMPTAAVEKLNQQLEAELNSFFWKGDPIRFGTNGSQEGLFLLPNYEIKTTWFPTDLPVRPSPFKAVVAVADKNFEIVYQDEKLSIRTL